jgi:hypothetical protein
LQATYGKLIDDDRLLPDAKPSEAIVSMQEESL